ncbi:MAG: peptidyl-prolyl cis-trans isomerase, partial [Cellvibrionaceae bacterium]|nr:peptidyl-prolyl cis-trans isomerase [Cellvibrionaceae bacterium]
ALAQYQQDIKVFEGTERRRIAHILVEDLGDGADADKVSSIAQRLGAGDDFAAVAKELSEDIATADSGGDLGFSSGDSFPAAVEEAIKTMSVGAVSEAVVSEYGTHFVKLLELDKPEPPSFAESKAEIVNKLVDQKGLQRFDELVLELEELAYNADDLSVVAEPLGLTLQSSDWLARGQAQGVLANSKVMAAIFSDEVLKERASSEPIELGDAQQVVVRVTDYQAPAVKPLAEVEPQIVASLTAKTIVERQQQAAAKLQQAAEQGASLEALAKVDSYPWEVVIQSRRDNFQVDRQLLESVFSQRSKTLPAMNTVALANGDLVLVQLNKISELDPASIAAGEKAPVAKQLEQQQAMAQYGAFQAQLKAEMDSQVF